MPVADWMYFTQAPPTDQRVTAGTSDAAAKKAGQFLARNAEGDGGSTFPVWVLPVGAIPEQFMVTVTTTVSRAVTVAPTIP